ncbi:hypothetical protein DFQ27_009022 [Actinomortierella ambigua]|uniref:F-box domain-containing protein n=1 Tax=Actinomortierella ambigua TaxID=1343610 RepID=A0A9P6PQ33_9FUNG|nr:hypothetical protein DFQ27_009022 [Actinomortierella ambigua]
MSFSTNCFAIPALLDKIVSHLDSPDLFKAATVCSSWQDAFLKYAFRDIVYLRNTNGFQELAEHGRHVQQLKTFSVFDSDLDIIASHCPNLKGLTLETEDTSIDALYDFFQRVAPRGLSRLELHLKHMGRQRHLIFPVLASQAWPSLTTLTLSGRGTSPATPGPQSRLPNSIEYRAQLREAQKREPWRMFVPDTLDTLSPEAVKELHRLTLSPFEEEEEQEGGTRPEDGNSNDGGEGQESQARDPIVWKRLKTVRLVEVEASGNGQTFLVQLLQRSPEIQAVHLERSTVFLNGMGNHPLLHLHTFSIEGRKQLHLESTLFTFFSSCQLPQLRSLTLQSVFPMFTRSSLPPQIMDRLEHLSRRVTTGAETQHLDHLLTVGCPRLERLSIQGLKWSDSSTTRPDRWRCRAILREFEGGLVIPYWGRANAVPPVPTVHDVYRHLPALRRLRFSQRRFRLFYGWLVGLTSLNELYKRIETDEGGDGGVGGGMDTPPDEQGDELLYVITPSSLVSMSENNLEGIDPETASTMATTTAATATTNRTPPLPQIRTLEVEILEDESEAALRVMELQTVVRAMPNLEAIWYLGRRNPFTHAAWEWVGRTRPDICIGHLHS